MAVRSSLRLQGIIWIPGGAGLLRVLNLVWGEAVSEHEGGWRGSQVAGQVRRPNFSVRRRRDIQPGENWAVPLNKCQP